MDNRSRSRQAELRLSGDQTTLVRSFVRDMLTAWRYAGEHEDVVLVASELVTNAFAHGGGTPMLRLSGTPWHVRVEVADATTHPPRIRKSGSDGGWGLKLVENLSTRWGFTPADHGKVVWCEFTPALVPVEAEA
ncbi:ATP-binding protein [Amycolatopsis sp. NPDC059657]|uniref:ATP-binding protein n=1 Tax=Amycolatopsis sp. NPDC059657 TaxID=3346899 RepID=UPI0036710289